MAINLAKDIQEYVDKLNEELLFEGITAWKSDTEISGGFQRVFFSRGGQRTEGMADLYLDLRLGLETPWGRTVEMASATPGTYGIPGFARHIAGQANISSPHETFKDYVRSIYAAAQQEQKLPREVAWGVYQGGFPSRMYPGARSWGAEEGANIPFMPQAGGIVTPGASTGTRTFMSRTVRYFLPQGGDEQKYFKEMTEGLATGKSPFGVIGQDTPYAYAPELSKWKSWVPISYNTYTGQRAGDPEDIPMAMAPRAPAGVMKSLTTATEVRELSTMPLVRNPKTGRLERIPPSVATPGGWGVRTGWTQSTGILPGETAPRVVYAGQTAFVDQPELPGAVLAAKGAFTHVTSEGKRVMTYGVGNEGSISYTFGTGSVRDFMKLVNEGNLKFNDIEGKLVRSGSGKFSLGSYETEDSEGNIVRKATLIDRKGYNYRLGRMTLHIPEYYDPTKENLPFSNVPIDIEGELKRTDETVRRLKELYGDQIDIVQSSAKGTGGERDPAQVYITAEMQRITPIAFKTQGSKGYLAQTSQKFAFEMFGLKSQGAIQQEFVTQETKIPARGLMGAFGVMEQNTQKKFLQTFLPQDTPQQNKAMAGLLAYIDDAYKSTGTVGISYDRMAEIWSEQTGKPTSADLLFSMAINNVLKVQATGDKRAAKSMWRDFMIGIPTEQMAPGLAYSRSNAAEMNRLLSDISPEAAGLVTFQERPVDKMLRATGAFEKDATASILESKYKVAAGGNLSMVVGHSVVPEYPSSSSYINAKAIESLLSHWPVASRAMGLADEQGRWAGVFSPKAYSGGTPPPDVRGWNELHTWGIVQGDLNRGNVRIPNESIGIKPELAGALNEIISRAEGMPNDKAVLDALKSGMEALNIETMGYAKANLANSYLYDPNTNTVVPKLTSVIDVEHWKEGVKEGETQTYWGRSYLRLLKAAVESSASSPGAMIDIVGNARNRFMNKLQNAFYPEGKRSKGVFRNIVGMQLPGMRGGRYQGMTELETGEAYADDNYIRRMLANSGFKNAKQIDSILRYLNRGADAYLPILFQRQPDISGEYTMVPLKLRSARYLQQMGVEAPRGPAGKDLIFIATNANRFQVGDYDGDQGASKVLPIFNMGAIDETTNAWGMTKDVQKEFDYHFNKLYRTPNAVDSALAGMFGKYGTANVAAETEAARIASYKQSLDVTRKNIADYIAGARGNTSLKSRLAEPSPVTYRSLLDAALDVKGFKGGMGAAYNVRTLTTDIASAVLGLAPEDYGVFSKAYETGSLAYQSYLDRLAAVKGGFTQLETMMSSMGLYDIGGEPGERTYRISYKLTEQGKRTDIESKSIWPKVGGSGLVQSEYMLRSMIGSLAGSSPDLMTNAMLAWGFGTSGRKQEVLTALENPEQFWISMGKSKAAVAGWLPETRTDRSLVLGKMLETGAVGFNSPYYVMLAHSAINRLQKNSPELLADPSIALPWGDSGKMTAVGDIVKSKEFRVAEALNNLVISGGEFLSPDAMELLSSLGGTRLAGIASGVYNAFEKMTGGFINADIAEREYGERAKAAFELFQANKIKTTPIVNASELGGLLPISAAPKGAELKKEGWTGVSEQQMAETTYGTVLRSMGLGHLIGDVAEGGAQFIRTYWQDTLKKFAGGMAFEEAFKKAHPEYLHTGQAESMKFKVGGVEIHGKPDFIRYDEATNEIVILDTKSPWAKEGIEYTEAFATQKAKKYQYRAQLMSYAYGMEKLGNELPYEGWKKMLTDWGVEESEVAKWQNAANRGAIRMEIAPGRVAPDGGLQEFSPITMKWTPEQKQEYEDLIGVVQKNVFAPKQFGYVAAETYSTLQTSTRVPRELSGYRRSGLPVDTSMLTIMKNVAQYAGYSLRAAGGGRFDRISGKRIRVGEGGPEEIIVGKSGVTIVPAGETTEARAARGEYFPIEGYQGSRYQGGVVDPDDIEAQGFLADNPKDIVNDPGSTIQQETPPAEQEAPKFDMGLIAQYNAAFTGPMERLYERMEELTKQQMEAMKQGYKITFGGTSKAPNQIVTQKRLASAMTQSMTLIEPMQKWNYAVRDVILGAMKAQGGDYAEIAKSYAGGINTATLMQMVSPEGEWALPKESWMPELRRRGLVEGAKGAFGGASALASLTNLVTQAGGFEQLISQQFEPELQDSARRLQKYVESPSGAAHIIQGGAAAESLIKMARSEPELAKQKMTGATVEAYESLAKSMQKLDDATQSLTKAQLDGRDATKEHMQVMRSNIEVRRDEARVIQETLKMQESAFFKGGKFVGLEEAARLGAAGEAKESDWAQVTQYRRAIQAQASAERQLERFDETGGKGVSGQLGRMSRRLLGGFGLMYLRSIANIITGPAMQGYQESIQEQGMAEAALGGAYGGMEMTLTPAARIARAKRAMGGVGGYGLQGLYASALENPATAGLLNFGQSAIGGAGVAMFLADMAGAGSAVPMIGLAAGVGAGIASIAGGAASAMSNPEEAAISLLGRNLWSTKQNAFRFKDNWGLLGSAFDPNAVAIALEQNFGAGKEGGMGPIEESLNEIDALRRFQQANPAADLRASGASDRTISAYAKMLANQYATEPQYTFQALQLQQMYQVPLTTQAGGGLENLAVLLQQGQQVQQVARLAAYSPWATGASQAQIAGSRIQDYATGGMPSLLEQQYLQEGASFIQKLGIMAPNLPMAAPEEVVAHLSSIAFDSRGTTRLHTPTSPFDQYKAFTGAHEVTSAGLARYREFAAGEVTPERVAGAVTSPMTMDELKQWIPENMNQLQQEMALETAEIQKRRRMLGLSYREVDQGFLEEFAGMGEEELVAQSRLNKFDDLASNFLEKLSTSFQQLGEILPDVTRFEQMTMGQQAIAVQAGQAGFNLSMQMLRGGATGAEAQGAGRMFLEAAATPEGQRMLPMLEGLTSFNRQRWGAYLLQNPEIAQQIMTGGAGGGAMTLPGIGGSQIPMSAFQYVGVNNAGQLTGLDWGRTSLATATRTSQQVAQQLWGTTGEPGSLIEALVQGGTRQGQIWQQQQAFQQQREQLGVSWEQLQLQRWYMPQVFALQERGRQLSYAQTEWGLQQQSEQLAIGRQNFAATTGFQFQQMQMQRGWTQEDWRYQGQVRAMQWGWQQEDFAENVRFMTGRERRLAERQMGRQTIMHDLESEQIEKQKGRQRELWALEDERFQQQIAYQESLFNLQARNISQQEEFYHISRQLQEEQAALSIEYWERSIALQEKQLGISSKYASIQEETFETMQPLNALLEDVQGQFNLLGEQSLPALLRMLYELDPAVRALLEAGGYVLPSAGGGGDWGEYIAPMQHGGSVLAGESYLVGERGIEIFKPSTSGEIIPLDPWGTTVTSMKTNVGATRQGAINLMIYLGNELLYNGVVDVVDQEIRL